VKDDTPQCALCGCALDRPIARGILSGGTEYGVYGCPDCRVGRTFPSPSGEELAAAYSCGIYRSSMGKRFLSPVESFILHRRVLRRRRIERYCASGRILDIGCGRGFFLRVMKQAGWSVAGVEHSRDTAREAARISGGEVVAGEPQEWGFAPGSFDVVTMNHVLEHLPDPAGWVRAAARLLKAGGLLLVAVPNLGSLQATAGKEGWFHLDIPRHLHHFTREGLRSFLEREGFRVVRTRDFDLEYDPFGWLQTLLNRCGIRRNLLFDLLKRRELRSGEGEPLPLAGAAASVLLLPAVLPAALLLSLAESFLLRSGGTVEMHALRRSQDPA